MAMETLKTDGLILRSRSSDMSSWDAAHAVNFKAHSLRHWRLHLGQGDRATLLQYLSLSTIHINMYSLSSRT